MAKAKKGQKHGDKAKAVADPAAAAGPKAPGKPESGSLDEVRELAVRSARLIELAPLLRRAEEEFAISEESHKRAEKRLETVQMDVIRIVYEMESIRKGNLQATLAPAPGEPKKPAEAAPEITEDLPRARVGSPTTWPPSGRPGHSGIVTS